MISAADRQEGLTLIAHCRQQGARLAAACEVLGISKRTYRRWQQYPQDRRPTARRAPPPNRLSAAEQQEILAVCHQAAYASLPPSQIVPRLADQGRYLASESSFYRVLRAHGALRHRGHAAAPVRRAKPHSFAATAPGQVWTWDITYLRGPIAGVFYYLYLIVDIYSRKIVGWEVQERESAASAAELIQGTVWKEGVGRKPKVLHADNGSPMKGATLRVTLQKLGIEPSYSRPRVSDDNPYSEALFRTCKYRPDFPERGFSDLAAARSWVQGFTQWYNETHRHSGIRFVTPAERHRGEDPVILAKRQIVYTLAKARHPERWSGNTRNWTPIGTVWLNPDRELVTPIPELLET